MQKLKTSVMKKTVNPVWNEDLTLAVMDASAPIKLVSIIHLFDHFPLMIDNHVGFLNAALHVGRLISEMKKKTGGFRQGHVQQGRQDGGRGV
jgi:Ca2+-dependent lipid-binding protein